MPNARLDVKQKSQGCSSLIPFYVAVQVAHVQKEWRAVRVLYYRQPALLDESAHFPGTQAQVFGSSPEP
jgi:hypothetical protein